MKVLRNSAASELEVRGSRFISEVFGVSDQAAAREKLREQKLRYADATHVVHAFVLGPTGGIQGCSDDGEPSGTSGRPTLEVLKGSGITNILLTTTRYFGGTKLGTGGLVKAYTEAAQRVLAAAETAELVAMRRIRIGVAYAAYDAVRRAVLAADAEVGSETFDDGVTLQCRVRLDAVEALHARLNDMTCGKLKWEESDD